MATIKDVAKLANVSKTTVSRYLNQQDAGHMSYETKMRIKDAIEKMDYNPNSIARSLKQKKTHVVGLVVHDMANPFVQQMIQGVEMSLQENNYNLLLCSSHMDVQKEIECLNMLEQRQTDGILLVGMSMPTEHLTKIKLSVPLVLLERDVPEHQFDMIKIDNEAGTRLAMNHLIERGHKKIAHICGAVAAAPAAERRRDYLNCMAENGLPVPEEYLQQGDYSVESGFQCMERLLKLKDRPSAVFCANDNMAIGAMECLIMHGISIPGDMAVVGFDDIPMASMFTPTLTTVRQPVKELAETATRLLLSRIKEGTQTKLPKESIVMEAELVIRKST